MEAFIRETKRKTLSFLHYVQGQAEQRKVNELLAHYDMEVIQNKAPKKVKSILFIVTRFVRFHGGQTSVLRLGTKLVSLGYRVSYAVYKKQSKEEMQFCASSNLKDFRGKFHTKQELGHMLRSQKKGYDVVVATSWDTVSYAKKLLGYKMYFVQDFEPYFYNFGEQFLLAKKTYEQGLHMVSLGDWNVEMIRKHCNPVSPLHSISFPYEKTEYPRTERDYFSYKEKKELTFAVYLKYYGKRLPCIISHMLEELTKLLKKDGISLSVQYFGEAKTFVPKGGENLGMLSKQELLALYQSADFGMVASLSNISLVPYEMLATGLPLIEFLDGTFSYFFPEESALLTAISAKDLYAKLKASLQNPEILVQRQKNAAAYMEDLSWERTGKEFAFFLSHLESQE